MRPQGVQGGLRCLWATTKIRPWSVTIPCSLIVSGMTAFALGADASRAFVEIGGIGEVIAHLFGALLLFGSLICLLGIARQDTFLEGVGALMVATGAPIYGVGVITGLGLQGMVTGPAFLGIAAGAALRLRWVLWTATHPNGPRR
jgi:hypothetical protein